MKTEQYLKELNEINTEINPNNKEIEWPINISNTIETVRVNIPNKSKEKWIIYEALIEKTLWKLRNDKITDKIKNKPGRPKKITSIRKK